MALKEGIMAFDDDQHDEYEALAAETRKEMAEGLATASSAFLVWEDEDGKPHARAFGAKENQLPARVAFAATSYLSGCEKEALQVEPSPPTVI